MNKRFRTILLTYISHYENEEKTFEEWARANRYEEWIEEAKKWRVKDYSDARELIYPS